MITQTKEIVVIFGDILRTIVAAYKRTGVNLLCTLSKNIFWCYTMIIDDNHMLILPLATDIDMIYY